MEEEKKINSTDIDKLWQWFEENEPNINQTVESGDDEAHKDLANSLDERILTLGLFTWDIELGETKKFDFIISPNRDAKLLEISKKIITKAPDLERWEFKYAKNKVKDTLPFKVFDRNQDPHIIHADSWNYKLENGIFYIYAENLLAELDQETEEYVLDIIATSYLGEEYRIMNVSKIVRVTEANEAFSAINQLYLINL